VAEGKTVQINTVVAIIESEGAAPVKVEAPAEAAAAPVPPAEPPPGEEPQEAKAPVRATPPRMAEPAAQVPARPAPAAVVQPRDIRTSPLVRRMARENDIDLSEIRGAGLEGRITKQDVLNYLEQKGAATAIPAAVSCAPATVAAPAQQAPADIPAPAIPPRVPKAEPAIPEMPRFFGETESVPMTAMRKAIAEHMVLSKHTSAHVNTLFEIDVTAIVKLRDRYKDEFEKREGIKLTYTPFFVKALVDTVREFPVVNCSISGDNIVFKKPVNVGIAVALETGLIVPVIRGAQLKSFTGIALACHDLAHRARSKKLRPEDVQNGTISITNPGIYGSLFGTPIISQPQVAILGVGAIEKRPVVIDDAIAIRSMVYLSLTFDHRVIDGAVADQFMASLKNRLQSWSQWID
jgi:2-oxoglutarate dehydrogenase E2 component (dihydrolipoamide succinyltransferase)